MSELFTEKYRPHTVNECVLPPSIKQQAQSMVNSGGLTHLLLSGSSGTGKTTLARALCNDMGVEYKMYNGSDGSLNIEELRNNIADFALTVNLGGGGKIKVIIIDEADGLSRAIQGALRNAMETYSNSCRFILTCNYPEKIIQALKSRCSCIDFTFNDNDRNDLIKSFANRILSILTEENIEFDVAGISAICMEHFPDNRRILNEIQRYTATGNKLDVGILEEYTNNSKILFGGINNLDYDVVKNWVVNNNVASIFDVLYSNMEEYIPKDNIMEFVMVVAEGQSRHHVVPNQELNALGTIATYMNLIKGE